MIIHRSKTSIYIIHTKDYCFYPAKAATNSEENIPTEPSPNPFFLCARAAASA